MAGPPRVVLAPAATACAALCGCVPFEAPLETPVRRLTDEASAPLDTDGASIGTPEDRTVEDAARDFLRERSEGDRSEDGDTDGTPGTPALAGEPPAQPTDGDGTAGTDETPGAAGAQPAEGAEDESDPDDPRASGAVALTLADVRTSVLEGNLRIRVARFDPRLADEALNAERAKFDATITASASYTDAEKPTGNTTLFGLSSDDPALSGARGGFTELEQDREKLESGVGLRIPLPTGGRVGLRQSFEIDDKSAVGVSSTEDRAATRFSISQPLLRGAGVRVNTASIRIARLDRGTSEAETKLTTIRLLASAEKAYWRLWAAQRVLDVQREQLDLARENLRLVRELIREGASPAVARFGAELAVAQQLEGLVVAETQVRLRARELSRLLNRPDLPVGEPAEIETATDPLLQRYELDRDALIERAFAERLELLRLELELAADALRVDLARNRTLPVFALDFEFGLGDRRGTIASAFADSFDFENPTLTIGGRAEIPLTNNAAEARLRRTVLGRMQRLASRDRQRLAVRQEVHDAADVLEQNWQRILAARQNVIAATGNYEAEQRLFVDGLRTAQDVLIALQQLGSARQREVRVIAEYQAAQIDLAFATGVLLGHSGAELGPSP